MSASEDKTMNSGIVSNLDIDDVEKLVKRDEEWI
jgi:hypothetical protein